MKTKNLLILSILLFSCQKNSFSQSKKTLAHYADLFSRVLIVQVEEENSHVIEKLQKEKKSDFIAQYRNDIKQYNINMKEVTERYWQVNDSIEYKTFKEIMAIPEEQRQKFVVLRCVSQGHSINDNFTKGGYGISEEFSIQDYIDWDTKTPDNENGKKREYPYYLTMDYFPLNEYKKERTGIPAHAVTNIFTSKGSLACVILRIRREFEFAVDLPTMGEYRGNAHTDSLYLSLKNKVLLVSRRELDPALDANKIKEIYGYPVAVVSNDEFENAVLTCNSDTVLLHNLRLIFDWSGKKESLGIPLAYAYYPPNGFRDDYILNSKTFERLKSCADGKGIKK